MKIADIDYKLAESLQAQDLEEGPHLDWMLLNNPVGRFLQRREGAKAQKEIATLMMKAFQKWLGFTGTKQITPNVMLRWLVTPQRQYGLGYNQQELDMVMKDPTVKKILTGQGAGGAAAIGKLGAGASLGTKDMRDVIVAMSRVLMTPLAQTAQYRSQHGDTDADGTPDAQDQDVDNDGRIEPKLDAEPTAKKPAQSFGSNAYKNVKMNVPGGIPSTTNPLAGIRPKQTAKA